jgi:hypothetical protein
VLERFDYLSTVSGGGYIGGWLTAWMAREGPGVVAMQLREPTWRPDGRVHNPLAPEPNAIDRLREYSNYLTPRLGLFSADTWAAATIVLRNLLLNWLVLVPLLAAAVAVPQLAVLVAGLEPHPRAASVLAGLALALAVVAGRHVHRDRAASLAGRGDRTEQGVLRRGVLPLVGSALLLALAAQQRAWAPVCCADRAPWLAEAVTAATFAALWSIVVPVLGWLPHRPRTRWRDELVALVVSGLVSGHAARRAGHVGAADAARSPAALRGARSARAALRLPARARPLRRHRQSAPRATSAPPSRWRRWAWAPTSTLGPDGRAAAALPEEVTAETGAVHDPDVSDRAEHDREWWARLSGWILAIALVWLGVSLLCVLGGWLLEQVRERWLGATITAAGGLSGLATALLGRGAGTPSGARRHARRAVTPAPLGARPGRAGVHRLPGDRGGAREHGAWRAPHRQPAPAARHARPAPRPRAPAPRRRRHRGAAARRRGVPARAAGDARRVARLRARGQPEPLLAARLLPHAPRARVPRRLAPRSPPRPVHRLRGGGQRAAARVRAPGGDGSRARAAAPGEHGAQPGGGERLAWQQRKAESFVMTPLHCGNFYEGYRDARRYGGAAGVTLGTAMAISGAAANPNMGYHSAPLVTLLMTLFNARLGMWLGNTNHHGDRTYCRSGADVGVPAARRRAVRDDHGAPPVREPLRRRPLRQPGAVRGGAAPLPRGDRERRGVRPGGRLRGPRQRHPEDPRRLRRADPLRAAHARLRPPARRQGGPAGHRGAGRARALLRGGAHRLRRGGPRGGRHAGAAGVAALRQAAARRRRRAGAARRLRLRARRARLPARADERPVVRRGAVRELPRARRARRRAGPRRVDARPADGGFAGLRAAVERYLDDAHAPGPGVPAGEWTPMGGDATGRPAASR